MEPTEVSVEEASRNLEQALWGFQKQQAFSGYLLQEMAVITGNSIPTACVKYDKKSNEFQIIVNPGFFARITSENRVAVIEHEMLHFTTKHIFRSMELNCTPETMALHNIAMDISINQFIKDLPEGGVYPEQFTQIDGKPFPKWATYEEYFRLLDQTMPQSKGGSRDNKESEDNPHENEKTLEKYGLIDEHDFADLSEDDKRRMLQEASRIIRRTIDKTLHGQSKEAKLKEFQELLDYIDHKLRKLNTKALFKQAIRQSVVRSEREATWNRPNKRFGYVAPGTKQAKVPFLDVYCDTSGSMSSTELNRFIQVLFKLCGAASPNCTLNLWHTDLYHTMRFSKKTSFSKIPWESGGTDATDVAKKVNEKDSDLTIIMTDGYYTSDVTFKKNNVVWLISERGGLNHPCRNIGKTFLLEDLLNG